MLSWISSLLSSSDTSIAMTNKTTFATSAYGLFARRSTKFANISSKLIVSGGIKKTLAENVPKMLVLNDIESAGPLVI